MCLLHEFYLARRLGESFAVVGTGPIGLLVIQLLRAAGITEIYAVDPIEQRREAAVAGGARAADSDVRALRDREAGSRGFDVVIEATNSPNGAQCW